MNTQVPSVCQRIFSDLWNGDDHARLFELIDDDCAVDDYPRKSAGRGPLRFLDLINTYKAFVPDLRFRIDRHACEARRIICYWSARGRHWGVAGQVRPTARHIELRGILVASLSRTGRVEHLRGTWDIRRLIEQIGVEPARFDALLQLPSRDVRLRAVSRTAGVPLLLFPTMSLPGWVTWRRFIDALQSRRPVVTFQPLANRRAFQRAPVPRGYGVRTETAALKRALDASGIQGPFDLIGHSAGGTLALDFALEHSGDVRSLTLIEPSAAWALGRCAAVDARLRRFIDERMSEYRRPVTVNSYARFLRRTYREKEYDPRKSPRWEMLCAYRDNMKFRPALYKHRDDPARLRSIRFPVLLIRGRDSDPFHHAVIDALGRMVPDARVTEMSGGHVPHYGGGFLPFLRVVGGFQERLRA